MFWVAFPHEEMLEKCPTFECDQIYVFIPANCTVVKWIESLHKHTLKTLDTIFFNKYNFLSLAYPIKHKHKNVHCICLIK